MYLNSRMEKVILHGRIDGFLLTGWSGDGMNLLQQYVDYFGDVQTAALIASIRPKSADARTQNWVSSYSDLLDQWELFYLRANFDIQRKRLGNDRTKITQLNIRCTYCNHSISSGPKSNENSQTFGLGNEKSKSYCCPNCVKPLPRCSLCLLAMGSSLESNDIPRSPGNDGPSAKFEDWFSWCMNCQHGGHAGHLYDWFQSNNNCPVSSCDCTCFDRR